MTAFDLITMGRVGVDLYPEQVGTPLADVKTFAKSLGGSPANVAVAASRLGARGAVITKVGDDAFGAYVRRAWGISGSTPAGSERTRPPHAVVFCEVHPPDPFPLLFYREPAAPDMNLTPDELDLDAIVPASVFWTTGTGLSAEPSRSTTLNGPGRPRQRGPRRDHGPRPRPPADVLAARGRGERLRPSARSRPRRWRWQPRRGAVAVGTRNPPEASAALLDSAPASR